MEEQQAGKSGYRKKESHSVMIRMRDAKGKRFSRQFTVEAEDAIQAHNLACIKAFQTKGDGECIIGE